MLALLLRTTCTTEPAPASQESFLNSLGLKRDDKLRAAAFPGPLTENKRVSLCTRSGGRYGLGHFYANFGAQSAAGEGGLYVLNVETKEARTLLSDAKGAVRRRGIAKGCGRVAGPVHFASEFAPRTGTCRCHTQQQRSP